MASQTTYRDLVREIALDNHGYVTTKAATSAGVPAVELPKLAARGGLDHVAYGLYRVTDLPSSRFDQFAEALLRVGDDAHLHGESVLALFGLADATPRRVTVAVPRRARPTLPSFMELIRVPADAPTTRYEGLAAQPMADALLECRKSIPTERLMAAAEQARRDGLLTTGEWRRVRRELRR